MNILRWIVFIPVSVAAAAVAKLLISRIRGIYAFFIPEVAADAVNGFFAALISVMVFLWVVHWIAPTQKRKAVYWSAIAAGVYVAVETASLYYLASKGLMGSYWFPTVLALGYAVGLCIGAAGLRHDSSSSSNSESA